MNEILLRAMQDGRLEAIFRRWNMWNDDQPRLYARLLSGETTIAVGEAAAAPSVDRMGGGGSLFPGVAPRGGDHLRAVVPLNGARRLRRRADRERPSLWAARRFARLLTGWVELIRGTPLLLQLFVLYFGLAAVVQLPAFIAALIGLGLNYAAYESEIYRGALEAVPAGQLDAARTLGLSERQTLVLVRGPQAFRLALAPMTNDFVALLKDSSLVSVITVVELTKETSIFAANIGSWLLPGAMCAAMYLALSLPLARLARRLEKEDGAVRVDGPRWMVREFSIWLEVTRGVARRRAGRLVRGRDVARASPSWGRRAPARRACCVPLLVSIRSPRAASSSTGCQSSPGRSSGRARTTRVIPTGRNGFPVPPPVRAPHGAPQRLAGSGARAAPAAKSRRTTSARAARADGHRGSRARDAARVVRR